MLVAVPTRDRSRRSFPTLAPWAGDTGELPELQLHHTARHLSRRTLQVTVQLNPSPSNTVSPKELNKPDALFLAGHPALDFLNTRMRVNEDLVDLLQSDEDVLFWLQRAGFSIPTTDGRTRPLALTRSARRLRESIRSLVEKRKTGGRGDPSILNSFLAASQSYPQVVWNKSNTLTTETVRRQDTAESILAPVAEAAADLLTRADFKLVKRCEDESCVLWFCDQTKSHHRRWCSMEICGNRHKVAAYRERRRNGVIRSGARSGG
jgi:predicted RNA-binding Zn ribbon-like protein